jgi:E3 ubiquitin-protein ligase RBBP6
MVFTGVRGALMSSEDQICPADGCGEPNVAPNSLIPNKFLRQAVTNFLNETGYAQIKKRVQDERENSPSLRSNSPVINSKNTDLTLPSPKVVELKKTRVFNEYNWQIT